MYFAAWSTYEAKFLHEKLTELRAKILNLVGDELFDLFFTSYASTMFALGKCSTLVQCLGLSSESYKAKHCQLLAQMTQLHWGVRGRREYT
jgi:hypothetical protein